MEITVLDKNFRPYALIDSFESFIWTDRYNEAGDFEFRTVFSKEVYDAFVPDYYLTIPQSDRLMIIEAKKITYDAEDGDHLTVTGHSLESILSRRVVWGEKTINAESSVQDTIKTLINESIIAPSDTSRKIDNFIFVESTEEEITIPKTEEKTTYVGNSIYQIVCDFCKKYHFGFKITLNDSNQFEFEMYLGTKRGYDQNIVPPVIFSPEFGNLVSSNYIDASALKSNAILMHGSLSGTSKTIIVSLDAGKTGLDRKEKEGNTSNIVTTTKNGNSISASQYKTRMNEAGLKQLENNDLVSGFEGEIGNDTFEYGRDFFIGDIVQMEDAYGHSDTARVTEMIISYNENGLAWYPTFKSAKAEKQENYESGEL